MTWQDEMLADFTRLVRARTKRTEEVKYFEMDADATTLSEGCDTCGYGEQTDVSMSISFLDEDCNLIYRFYGDWTELLNAINGLDS